LLLENSTACRKSVPTPVGREHGDNMVVAVLGQRMQYMAMMDDLRI